jgi:hypothetical protein
MLGHILDAPSSCMLPTDEVDFGKEECEWCSAALFQSVIETAMSLKSRA